MQLRLASSRLATWRKAVPFGLKDAAAALFLPLLLPMLVYLSISFWGSFGLLPSWAQSILGETPVALALQYTLTLMIEIGVLLWLVRKRHAGKVGLGLRRASDSWYLAAFGLYFAQIVIIIGVFALVSVLLPSVDTEEQQAVFEFGRSGWGYWLAAVSAVVIAPIIEELLFRGVLFAGLAKRWPVWLAAVTSSLVFAVLHGQVNVGIYTFVLGCMLSWLYVRSGSIYPGILVHFLNNLVAFWLLSQN